MRVTYVGSYAEGVEIAATGQLCARFGSIDVDGALGVSLCDQVENWQPSDKQAEKQLAGLRAERAALGGVEVSGPAGAADSTLVVEEGELS